VDYRLFYRTPCADDGMAESQRHRQRLLPPVVADGRWLRIPAKHLQREAFRNRDPLRLRLPGRRLSRATARRGKEHEHRNGQY